MDTDTCVGYITRGKRKGFRCESQGVISIGIKDFKVCNEHSAPIIRYMAAGYSYPVWMEDLVTRGLIGRYNGP